MNNYQNDLVQFYHFISIHASLLKSCEKSKSTDQANPPMIAVDMDILDYKNYKYCEFPRDRAELNAKYARFIQTTHKNR